MYCPEIQCSKPIALQDVETYINSIVKTRSDSSRKIKEIISATCKDSILQEFIHLTFNGWPKKEDRLKEGVKRYFNLKNDLLRHQNILFYQDCIVIPQNLRAEILQAIYTGHLGLNKCRERAKMSVWWLKTSREIKDFIKGCEFCNCHHAANPHGTLRLASLLKLDGEYYLIVTDYFSRYFEIVKLSSLTSKTVIGKLQNIFARWGMPDEVVSDNGRQFTSTYFREFAKKYGFTCTTVSPHFPQANEAAESAVKIAKKIL